MGAFSGRTAGALLCFLSLLACAPAGAQRLPATIVPSHYDLAFDVDLSGARFEGVETIKATLSEPARRIVVHALEIQFHEVTIQAGGATQQAKVTLDAATETAALTVEHPGAAAPAEIHVRFAGVLNNK